MRTLEVTKKKPVTWVGLISDTHGLIRPEALHALRGVDLIVHSGDIGKPAVLDALKKVAPVIAIKGNNDVGAWTNGLADVRRITLNGLRCFVIHDANQLDFDPTRRGFRIVISGHSHKPSVTNRDGVLFVNPGSAGPRRFKLPVAIGKLRFDSSVKSRDKPDGLHQSTVRAEIVELAV